MKRLLPIGLALVAATILGAVVLLDRPPGPTSDPGVADLEVFFRSYVDALNKQDAGDVARVLGDAQGSAEVKDRLARYGGRGIHDVRISASTEFPQVYRVKLSATSGDGSALLIDEVVEWTGARWHLAPLPPASSVGSVQRASLTGSARSLGTCPSM